MTFTGAVSEKVLGRRRAWGGRVLTAAELLHKLSQEMLASCSRTIDIDSYRDMDT